MLSQDLSIKESKSGQKSWQSQQWKSKSQALKLLVFLTSGLLSTLIGYTVLCLIRVNTGHWPKLSKHWPNRLRRAKSYLARVAQCSSSSTFSSDLRWTGSVNYGWQIPMVPITSKTRKALICLNHQPFSLPSALLLQNLHQYLKKIDQQPSKYQTDKKYKWCCINYLKKPKHLALLTLRSRAPKTILTALQTYYKRDFFNNLHVIYFSVIRKDQREKNWQKCKRSFFFN